MQIKIERKWAWMYISVLNNSFKAEMKLSWNWGGKNTKMGWSDNERNSSEKKRQM